MARELPKIDIIIPYIKMFLEIYGKNVMPLSGVYGSILSLT